MHVAIAYMNEVSMLNILLDICVHNLLGLDVNFCTQMGDIYLAITAAITVHFAEADALKVKYDIYSCPCMCCCLIYVHTYMYRSMHYAGLSSSYSERGATNYVLQCTQVRSYIQELVFGQYME